jgi:hypothetical protein
MSSKSAQGKTEKYSGLVKKVKDTKDTAPEEPKITPEQVRAAFASFNLPVNDRGHNDVLYWTMKGQSEGPRLIEELSKKRKDINQKEDDTKKAEEDKKKLLDDITTQHEDAKRTLPRLSDKELGDLFDEYGLPAPDPEWARQHMPNDPTKIRSILDMQRKTADDMLKKHTKNAVNAIPEVPKPNAGGVGGPTPMQGRGGPSPVAGQGDMVQDDGPINPFFIGDHSIVRISNPNNPDASTLWLVDAKRKVLRPFLSEQAFDNAFDNPEEARKAIVTLSSKDLGPGGVLAGFTPLQATKGVNHDGSVPPIDFTPSELQNRYGQPQDPQKENRALSMLDTILGKMKPGGPSPSPVGSPALPPQLNNPQQ